MQVKTYTGPNNKAVMDQIKSELGLDAVILESRTGKENGKTVVRMTAALERPEPARAAGGMGGMGNAGPGAIPGLGALAGVNGAEGTSGATPARGAKNYAAQLGHEDLSALAAQFTRSGGQADAMHSRQAARWQEEWGSIKNHIFALMKPALKLELLTPQQRAGFNYLQNEGVSDPILLDVYRRLADDPGASIMAPLARLATVRPWGSENWRQRIHLISGPYGAGKTSAAVRMALYLQKCNPGARFCLVNADADRGGGRLLLKHYAGLSDFPYREASSPLDMVEVISEIRSQGFDKVLVDLPALPKDKTLVSQLATLGLHSNGYDAMAAHLVLTPLYDRNILDGLLARYLIDMDSSLIWSKLDETDKYAAILNTAAQTRLPVSCFSFGPGLRNTLVPAQSAMLWRLMFKHELPSIPA